MTRDPELTYTPKGTAVCNFGLAVNRTWKSESGEKQEECSFFDIVAFGKQAETVAQWMRKGKPLLLDGRLKQESWDDKQSGQKRYAVKVILESFTFLGDGTKREGAGEPQDREATPRGREVSGREQQPQSQTPSPVEDDDVPF